MVDKLKIFILKMGVNYFEKRSKKCAAERVRNWFLMTYLWRVDRVRWNVLRARELGAKVGTDCRFYSLNFFSEPYLIEIGNDVILSGEVYFVTHDGGVFLLKNEVEHLRGHYGRIKIGNNCFIGMGAIILPDVSIGNNSIVGAGAVVNRSFPDNSVIMGNPAEVVFKTSMYLKMRQKSPYTLTNEKYPFPGGIPEKEKREMLVSFFADKPVKPPLPIRKKKRRSSRN